MRDAIAAALVGDDVYGDDPTVNRLESHVASLLGKEAAVFVLSGTMANQLAIGTQCRPGDEVLIEATAHPLYAEAGGSAANWGVLTTTIPGERGVIGADEYARRIKRGPRWLPVTALLWAENTHNQAGGALWPAASLAAVPDVAHAHGLRAHLDGARLWNAAVAGGRSVSELAAGFDTVSVCFSKGLGAPIGSALCGDAETIARARQLRHRLGGGWRQAGLLAAAAQWALDHHQHRLADDHRRARRLGEALAGCAGIVVQAPIETNIVVIDVPNAVAVKEALASHGVLCNATGPARLRMVTHLDVDDAGIDRAIGAVSRVV